MIKMEYRGLSFPINPASIKTKFSKNISSKIIPFSVCRVQEINDYPTVITADGKFVGSRATQFAYELMHIYKQKGSSYLLLPDSVPVKAYFKNLDLSYDAKNNCVSYSVEFVEDENNKKGKFNFGYTYALKNENVYDVANRTDVDIEKLVEHNNFPDLFSLKEGDKVWLS